MHVFTCWTKHGRSVSPSVQLIILEMVCFVFKNLDFIPPAVEGMLASEVTRLETESRDKSVQLRVSNLLQELPEIRQLRLQSIPSVRSQWFGGRLIR